MKDKKFFNYRLEIPPELDMDFRPAIIEFERFNREVINSSESTPLIIAIERNDGLISRYETFVFKDSTARDEINCFHTERLVKTLLWSKGGWKIILGGSVKIGEYINRIYKKDGLRGFDAKSMSRIYGKEFSVETSDIGGVPGLNEKTKPVGGCMNGCRIGFDAGGSDYKISALIDGRVIYNDEVTWYPKDNSDPGYHYNEILQAIKKAASFLPRVDAIGISSAGIFINNQVKLSSLFVKVPYSIFDKKVKNIFLDVQKELGGIPMEVVNDGDVAAIAGVIRLRDTNVLGIAMGTSEAGGFVDGSGNITGWLNELAFIPVDFNQDAMIDEWSGDVGCGVKYFSQDAVIRLAPLAGIDLDKNLTPAEKLRIVQNMNSNNDKRAVKIFRTIGCYLGYAIAYYARFYDIRHIILLGRVTSGEGGIIIMNEARNVLGNVFPELSKKLRLHIPDETSRRSGQAVAAARLPWINKI